MSHFIQPCFDNKGKVAWKCTAIRYYSQHKLMARKDLKALNYVLPFGPKLASRTQTCVTKGKDGFKTSIFLVLITFEILSEQEKPDSKSTVKHSIFPWLLHM